MSVRTTVGYYKKNFEANLDKQIGAWLIATQFNETIYHTVSNVYRLAAAIDLC